MLTAHPPLPAAPILRPPAAAPAVDGDAAYLALSTRDARFDGRLFVGVTSTGVYCRPVCSARTPLRRHCRFYADAARAEHDGFRPCLRCRPELAPGLSLVDSSGALAQSAATLMQAAVGRGEPLSLAVLATRLGVTDRHLRRIFMLAHGVSPMDYLTTQRLLLAKRLLTDTPLAVTQVALACGFGSVRRFNTVFLQRYRLNPTALRRHAQRPAITDDAWTLRLSYRPPYDVDGVLGFLARRQLDNIEQVDLARRTWRRTLSWPHAGGRLHGWLAVAFDPQRHEARLTLSPSLAPVVTGVLRTVRHALDLDADPSAIAPTLAHLSAGVGLPATPGLRLPGSIDGFETAVRVILGQQVTVKAARTLVQRLVAAFGTTLVTPHAALQRVFPEPGTLAQADAEAIGRLGIVRQRVGAIQALARAVADGRLRLDRDAPLAETLDALRSLPGIGEWTVQVIAMRALAWPDAWPATDVAVLKALGTRQPAQATERAQGWRPWRAYAVIQLWQWLETRT